MGGSKSSRLILTRGFFFFVKNKLKIKKGEKQDVSES